jgi:hypothetical protein
MKFQQNQLTRSIQLQLREHGLHVCERDLRGQIQLELEMPYEEILPVQLERRSAVPQRQLIFLLYGLVALGLNAFAPAFGGRPLPDDFWLWAVGITVAAGLFVLFGLRNWWRQQVLHTARTHLVLADFPNDRAALRGFTDALRSRTKAYLRQEYGTVNPLGIIEPQVRRVAWLRELEVLTPTEARALTTRLTGQVPAATLRSMGQELEGLFVN